WGARLRYGLSRWRWRRRILLRAGRQLRNPQLGFVNARAQIAFARALGGEVICPRDGRAIAQSEERRRAEIARRKKQRADADQEHGEHRPCDASKNAAGQASTPIDEAVPYRTRP